MDRVKIYQKNADSDVALQQINIIKQNIYEQIIEVVYPVFLGVRGKGGIFMSDKFHNGTIIGREWPEKEETMEKVSLTTIREPMQLPSKKVEASVPNRRDVADEMKDIKRARLARKVFQDPAMARKLMVAESSPVYNAKGTLIQSVTNLDVG